MRHVCCQNGRGVRRGPVWAVICVVLAGLVARTEAQPGATRAPAAVKPQAYREASREGGRLRYVQGVPVMILQGTPEEMGRQQAALVGDVIRPLMTMPRRVVRDIGVNLSWSIVVELSRGLVRRSPEAHQQELAAMAQAARFSDEETKALWVANGIFETRPMGGCSSLLVEPPRSATGGVLFGRNLDYGSFGVLDRLGIVTIRRPTGKRAFASIGYPGFVGVISGMNDAGLALADHSVHRSRDNALPFNPAGTPAYTTYRRILEECATIDEAEKILRDTPLTIPANLAMADTRRAVVFEITTKNLVVRPAEESLLACTNHFRTPELSVTQSCWRFERFQARWNQKKPFTWKDVSAALAEVGHQGTLQTMIFEPSDRRVRLSLGPPPASRQPLVALELGPFFKGE